MSLSVWSCAFRRTYLLVLIAMLLSIPAAAAPPVKNAMVVEEDWTLIVDMVDPVNCSPQFVTGFPLGNNGNYFMVNWNFFDLPSFVPGGIQIQSWRNDQPETTLEISKWPLGISGDTLTWTQVVKTNGNDCEIKISGCNSQAWGTNINSSAVKLLGAGIAHFDNYDPQNSVSESGISFGKQRVAWFGITETRKYDDKGKLVSKDTSPKVVYQR